MITLDDIPERLRQPGLILNNGQIIEHTLTEKQTDELSFLLDIEAKKKEKEEGK